MHWQLVRYPRSQEQLHKQYRPCLYAQNWEQLCYLDLYKKLVRRTLVLPHVPHGLSQNESYFYDIHKILADLKPGKNKQTTKKVQVKSYGWHKQFQISGIFHVVFLFDLLSDL